MPLIVLAGKEYGSASSWDWAPKGAKLVGVVAVLAGRETVPGERNGDGTEFTATVRTDTPAEAAYFRHGGGDLKCQPSQSRCRRIGRYTPETRKEGDGHGVLGSPGRGGRVRVASAGRTGAGSR